MSTEVGVAVCTSGTFLSSLLFKLKNAPGDAVGTQQWLLLCCDIIPHRRDFCWEKCAVIKLATLQIHNPWAEKKKEKYVFTLLSVSIRNAGS